MGHLTALSADLAFGSMSEFTPQSQDLTKVTESPVEPKLAPSSENPAETQAEVESIPQKPKLSLKSAGVDTTTDTTEATKATDSSSPVSSEPAQTAPLDASISNFNASIEQPIAENKTTRVALSVDILTAAVALSFMLLFLSETLGFLN